MPAAGAIQAHRAYTNPCGYGAEKRIFNKKNISFAIMKKTLNNKIMMLLVITIALVSSINSSSHCNVSVLVQNASFENQNSYQKSSYSIEFSIHEDDSLICVLSSATEKDLNHQDPISNQKEEKEEKEKKEGKEVQGKTASTNNIAIDTINNYTRVLISQLRHSILRRRHLPLFIIFHAWKSFLP